MNLVKQYRAINADVCEKSFAPELNAGWFSTAQEALANWSPVAENNATAVTPTDALEEPVKRRTRTRKE